MGICAHKPGPPLSHFVERLWLFEGEAQPHSKERALPDGCAQLIVNLREDHHRIYDPQTFHLTQAFNGCLIVGPRSEFSVIDTPTRMMLAGVHFKPGGAFPFLAPPISELHGLDLPLDTLWGGFASELRERMLEAVTPERQFRVMEAALLARAARSLAPNPVVVFAIDRFERGPCANRVAEVTAETGFTPRRFIEIFRREVGLTPKLFCRVRRFQHALQQIAAGRSVSWTDVAQEAGYFDQAHFIHDFRAFSGLNPSQYCESRPWHQNHVPLPAA